MNEFPWLSEQSLKIVRLLLESYRKNFKESLLSSQIGSPSRLEAGKLLFQMRNPVLAHGISQDPYLIYANSTALNLWGISWEEMIKMPSRLTAPEKERKEREQLLKQAQFETSIQNYQGIRINSKGKLFIIKNTKIWTIYDQDRQIYGQAATFNLWTFL